LIEECNVAFALIVA
jgi:hypothetical protein